MIWVPALTFKALPFGSWCVHTLVYFGFTQTCLPFTVIFFFLCTTLSWSTPLIFIVYALAPSVCKMTSLPSRNFLATGFQSRLVIGPGPGDRLADVHVPRGRPTAPSEPFSDPSPLPCPHQPRQPQHQPISDCFRTWWLSPSSGRADHGQSRSFWRCVPQVCGSSPKWWGLTWLVHLPEHSIGQLPGSSEVYGFGQNQRRKWGGNHEAARTCGSPGLRACAPKIVGLSQNEVLQAFQCRSEDTSVLPTWEECHPLWASGTMPRTAWRVSLEWTRQSASSPCGTFSELLHGAHRVLAWTSWR